MMTTNRLSVVQKCGACGKDSPEAAMTCRFCQTRFDADLEAFFESEDYLPPNSPRPSVSKLMLAPTSPAPSASQLLFAEPASPKSAGATALMVVLVLAGIGSASAGLTFLSQAPLGPRAPLGLGLICGGCFLGILTSVIQARLHHRVLIHALSRH